MQSTSLLGQGSIVQHIFTLSVTGLPMKKTTLGTMGSVTTMIGMWDLFSLPSLVLTSPQAITAAPSAIGSGRLPATNSQGQRIYRQCGLPDRYKDSKCVEKWGPSPEGPSTVCDR